MATRGQKNNYIRKVRDAVTRMLDASADLVDLKQQGDDLGLLVTGNPNILIPDDFDPAITRIDDNAGIVASEFITAANNGAQAVNNANRQAMVKVRL